MKKFMVLFTVILVGCMTQVARVGGPYKSSSQNFSVELPEGWMRFNNPDQLLITRDGLLLQYILLKRMDIKEPLGFTKKSIVKGMSTYEVSEVVLDDIASNQEVLNYKIIENIPFEIGGMPGFRAVFTFKNRDGLKLKSVYCGFLVDKWFYEIRYTAALRYYFDKDIRNFELVLESFKLIKT